MTKTFDFKENINYTYLSYAQREVRKTRGFIIILLLHSWSTPHITAGQL
jgi:hypothetical protein